jgi:threonine ammonia-lyase medium form
VLGYPDIVQAYEKITKYKNPTFIQYSGTLSSITANQIFLKPENLQFTGSFKLGGAMNVMANLVKKDKNNGVVTCSAGNWAQAVAYAARMFNIRTVIVMAEGASHIKIEATKGYGAEVVIFGKDSNDVIVKAKEIARQEDLTFLSPFDDEYLIAGHGTVGMEIIKEKPDAEVIICPVGSGAFISGILLALKEKNSKVKIIGVEPFNSNAMWLSLQADKVVEKEHIDTIADGLALNKPGEIPFQIVKKYVDDIVLVAEDEIKKAVLLLLERAKLLVEPSGAVSVAALMSGKVNIRNKNVVAVLSGGNLDLDRLAGFI